MTISASRCAADKDLLIRSRDMYRDLSVALSEKIEELKIAEAENSGLSDQQTVALRAHRKAQQTVIELEASLVRNSKAEAAGGSVELDLTSARDEINARLAVWIAEG
jgi:hypothetical protein